MTLAGSLLKKALKTDTIILWQSLRPISIKLALRKLLGLFVSIIQIQIIQIPYKIFFTVKVSQTQALHRRGRKTTIFIPLSHFHPSQTFTHLPTTLYVMWIRRISNYIAYNYQTGTPLDLLRPEFPFDSLMSC